MKYSANDIASALGLQPPTTQQRAVIEAEPTPALVVAGAGSGKTETMANRVLWLVANGAVAPGEVLGLTFTRKAAGELGERLVQRIEQLTTAGLVPSTVSDPEFDIPQVSTYNAFANTIYRDHAILLGRESDGAVLGEASAWQLARSVVISSDDPRLVALDRSVDTVTKAVLDVSHSIAENVVDHDDVRAFAREFAAIRELPNGGTGGYEAVLTTVSTVAGLDVLVDLAERFDEAKKKRGFVEYSDQVTLALTLARSVPTIRSDFRNRFRVVLLDEYQDTSVVQTWLLAELFSEHPVMAVGDPHQSIYGWRGASAANLEQFSEQFAGGHAQSFSLTTSWRNGQNILAVANAIVEPLRETTRVRVDALDASPRATALPVDLVFSETIVQEAEAVATWLRERIRPDSHGALPSAAMLFRTRTQQRYFTAALRRAEIPFHVLGIGGLTEEPEIADLVSALAVVHDPSAGSELVRLLAGSRWRIGVRDLHALHRVAAWLRQRDFAGRPLADDVRQKFRDSVAPGEGGSIVDALDFVANAADGHSQLEQFSETGLQRIREAGRFFSRLRSRVGMDLMDFATFVEQELQLDIELAANETRSLGRASFEAFYDAMSGYLAVDEFSSLGGFLRWLREAEWRDALAPRPEEPEPGTVQIMTIHGSKGLERDIVVVPRMVDQELPGKPREGFVGWLGLGILPYEFRGDAAELPVFSWREVASRKEFLSAKSAFSAEVRERNLREERRLAYVAVTRARHSLLLSGSFWATQSSPRQPSEFLVELARRGITAPLPEQSEFDENPDHDAGTPFHWPLDPLGARRPAVARAAERVRTADPRALSRWSNDLDLLLEERRRRLHGDAVVAIPDRIPASRFKDYVADPLAVAAELRRPMPERPYRASRLGTLFHSWVEERYGVSGGLETIDASRSERDYEPSDDLPTAIDHNRVSDDERARLAELIATFESSEFAARAPVEVEIEIHVPLAGQILICKIDAVFERDGRYQIVDWKTGKSPADAADLESKQLQLALYRHAYASYRGIPADTIDAVFYFVADDVVIAPERIFGVDELADLWQRTVSNSQNAQTVVRVES